MKKIIAAMLILTLCVTTAFAADFTPGQKIRITDTDAVWEEKPENELSTSYYSIAGQSWETGKELVSGVTIDNDDNTVVINLKPDYTSTKEKTLKGVIKVRDKKRGRFLNMNINCVVGFNQDTISIEPDGNIANLVVDSSTVYTVTATDKGYPYGTLFFQADVVDVSVRVYDKERFFLGYSREPHKDTLIANAETDAIIEFINFEGTPTFSGTATMNFYGFEEGYHVYELKNGRLTKANVKWDKETDSHVLKTRTLGNYVISDKTLRSATGTTDNTPPTDGGTAPNPDTGANDVAGIASALAIMSLASAAAISLKKKRE